MRPTSDPSPQLVQDSRIAVVGGGPAGSFFALSILDLAQSNGIHLHVTIFERKDLTAAGPKGCNMCAGILSRRVVRGLEKLRLALPDSVILGRVRVYQLHWGKHAIPIEPPDTERQVLSVYRAGGPRKSPYVPTDGLDSYLLAQAAARGAEIVRERVEEILFEPAPRVCTPQQEQSFDLVVLATGINGSIPVLRNAGYRHPATEVMAQDALLIETADGRAQMDSTVHVYLGQPADLIFGALVPKGHFATVSLLGRQLGRGSIPQFLGFPEVRRVVGNEPLQMCGCRPRVAVSIAGQYFGDRFVAIGDACITRLYKDGIGSAFVTSRAAAETALFHGIGARDFERHYAPVCRAIARDNRFGRVVFALIGALKCRQLLMRALARALKAEARKEPGERLFGQTLWALFTGDSDYIHILAMMLRPRTSLALLASVIAEVVHTIRWRKGVEA